MSRKRRSGEEQTALGMEMEEVMTNLFKLWRYPGVQWIHSRFLQKSQDASKPGKAKRSYDNSKRAVPPTLKPEDFSYGKHGMSPDRVKALQDRPSCQCASFAKSGRACAQVLSGDASRM